MTADMDSIIQHLQSAGVEIEALTFSAGFCLHSAQSPDFLKAKLTELGYRICYATTDEGMSIVWFDMSPAMRKVYHDHS